jgi:hypothetical protein
MKRLPTITRDVGVKLFVYREFHGRRPAGRISQRAHIVKGGDHGRIICEVVDADQEHQLHAGKGWRHRRAA